MFNLSKTVFLMALSCSLQALTNPDPISWVKDSDHQSLNQMHFFGISETLSAGMTPYQDYLFVKTLDFGKILFIDGEVQSAEKDEYIYHESLIHPAMVAHKNPQSVLVIGAGEGATAREILRYASVQRLVLVDIDKEIIQHVKEFLPEWHQGSFDDPRVELKIEDGKAFVEHTDEKFDVVVLDVCDKLSDNSVVDLYTSEFYQSVKKILNPSGIVVVQSMEMQVDKPQGDQIRVYRNLKKAFSHVTLYGTFVPSFWSIWGYSLATEDATLLNLSPEEIDLRLEALGLTSKLRHYDGQTHLHMFSLPKTLRALL